MHRFLPEPVQPQAPMPHRKVIRSWLLPVVRRSTARALFLVALDVALFGLAMVATVWFHHAAVKLLCAVVAGLIIGRLFILGHDACHQSFTPHRRLNRWLGRLVFLPSLTPYSLWDVGHNVVHHGYTNLKGFDFVWHPHTLEEFQALPRWRQWLERVYRSGWASWLYYLIEVWWLRMMFPSSRQMPTRRRVFFWDCVLVSVAAVVWIAALVAASNATGQSLWLTLFAGFVLPFLTWNAMIGFVVYVHHTHAGIAWYQDKLVWASAQPFVSTTVHLTFRYRIGTLLHHIMEHTAHHVDMSIPLYRLKQAQQVLEVMLPGRIVIQQFSWRWYFDTARRCKLYDFKRRCWTNFAGQPTTEPVMVG
ncbi:fatty acid desaturase [Glaciimonas sp. PCH181]|uniref:fatty acid desaturase n=1 Tax=Glaciimonas sp. PCH181 TaxID=2133943 RepID=UPI001CED7761|nr:fatty acid desaturase [Glaciimonas sp. PCH181]